MSTIKQWIAGEDVELFILRPLVNADLTKIKDLLQNLSVVKSFKLAYAASITTKRINQELDLLKELRKENDAFSKFRERVSILQVQYAKKKANGEPIIKAQTFSDGNVVSVYDIDDHNTFDKCIQELEIEFSKTIKEQEVKNKNYEDSLKELTKVDLYTVDREAVKDLELTSSQFLALSFILKNGIVKEDIPEDICMEELLILMDFFNIV